MSSRKPRAKAAVPPASNPNLAPALASAALLVLAALDAGPLGFLPAVLRWPLAVSGIAAVWLPRAGRHAERLPRWAPAALEGLALALIFGSYLLLKVVGLHASDTDDNIYFYMARRFAQGAAPYRDFFFAHPPIHLVVPALVFGVAGFSLPLAKAIAPLAQVVAGVCLYLALRRASRPLALLAVLLHLTAYEVLMGSTDMDGENLMTAFLAAAVLLALRGRPLASGALAGLALGTGLYALAGAVALAVAFAGQSRRSFGLYAAGLAGCIGLWAGVFGALGGAGFVDGVVRYHLAKAPSGARVSLFASANPLAFVGAYLHNLGEFLGERTFGKSVVYHASLYVGAALGLGFAIPAALRASAGDGAARRGGARRLWAALLSGTPQGAALLGGAGAILFLLQWAALNEVYDFYLVPMIAFLAIPAAWALVRVGGLAAQASSPAGLLLPGLAGAAFCLHPALTRAVHDRLWPDELREKGRVVTYAWREPAAFAPAARLARALFFVDRRTKGEINPPYRHYLWNKSLTFSSAEEIAAYVRANSAADETITGASTPTPLVALLAERRVAADEADTNNKRFRSGLLSPREFWDRACADRVRFVLAAPRSRFTEETMERDPTARRWFAPVRVFEDRALRHFRPERFVLYRRRDLAEPLPAGRVCAPVEEASASR